MTKDPEILQKSRSHLKTLYVRRKEWSKTPYLEPANIGRYLHLVVRVTWRKRFPHPWQGRSKMRTSRTTAQDAYI